MSQSLPLVSVVTPTYNCATYLIETIESVLAQGYPNLEYIVLDDGSTDNTREILQGYTGRIIWESHENMGEQRTTNKGWEMATGEYIVTLSADDPILPGLIHAAVAFMEKHPDILVAYPGWKVIDEHSKQIREPAMFDYDYLNMLRWQHCFPGPGSFIRRKAFELEPVKRDPSYRYIGDFEYWMRLGLHGQFGYIPQVLATWRQHSAGTTAGVLSNNPRKAAEHVQAVINLYQRPDLPEAARQIRDEVFGTVYYIAGLRCLPNYRGQARRYFLRSLWHCPFKSLKNPLPGYSRSWRVMLETILLPQFARNLIRPMWRSLKSRTRSGAA